MSVYVTSLVLILVAAVLPARAEVTIFDVRKNLPLSDTDKVFRDFYINGGTESGLSSGMVVTVQRRMPLYDSYQNRSAGDLDVKVAKIKLIHVQKGLAVARLHSEFDRATAPLLEDNFIMVGDRLDLATAVPEKVEKADSPKASGEPVAATSTEIFPSGRILVNSVELSSVQTVDVPARQ